ncbi:hypothetical protein BX616_003262, partial [Lobosporangium transversale]
VVVPLLYWAYLAYAGDARLMAIGVSPDSLWRNYSFHGGDLIIVMIEFFFNAMPIIPSHIIIVLFICLLYLAEAHVVYSVNGFWLYPFLDTSIGPIWVALYLGVGVVIVCAFFFMFSLHKFKYWLLPQPHQKQQQQQQQQQQEQEQQQGTMLEDNNNQSVTIQMNLDNPYNEKHPSIQRIQNQNQNRKRSDSDSSNISSTSTLIGLEEGSANEKESLSRRISRKLMKGINATTATTTMMMVPTGTPSHSRSSSRSSANTYHSESEHHLEIIQDPSQDDQI